jgi:hypothetical protein
MSVGSIGAEAISRLLLAAIRKEGCVVFNASKDRTPFGSIPGRVSSCLPSDLLLESWQQGHLLSNPGV